MEQEYRIKFSNELTKIYLEFERLGAKQKDLDNFDNLITEIIDYKEKPKGLGEILNL